MVSPGVARFKAEIHFNSVAICDKYLDLHDNATALGESFRSTGTDAETRRVARRYAQHMYMMFGLEVDRLEALIRQKCPEFKYIDLEPL
mmetsp:Transcript_1434/g.3791  ORF Transcript_1434/g.3791 Transcript_1434/m.3791 type:complete len:89 (+) Transcript_1434:132-398(+)